MSQESEVLERIAAAFRCAFPVVALTTFEVARARAAVTNVAADLGRHYHEMHFKLVPDPGQIKKIADCPDAKRGVVIFDPYFQDRQRSATAALARVYAGEGQPEFPAGAIAALLTIPRHSVARPSESAKLLDIQM